MPISQNKSYDFNYDPTRGANLIFSKYNFSSQTLATASNNGDGNSGIYIGLTGSLNINSNGICTNTLIEGNSSDVCLRAEIVMTT
jgi:hypothetical protein